MRPVVLTLVSALLFGAAAPGGKLLLPHVHPVQLAGWFYLGAAVGVAPMLRGRLGLGGVDGRSRMLLGGAVLFGGVLGPVALLLGLRLASASSVSLWLNLELVATAVLGAVWFRDHLGKAGWAAVAGVVGSGMLLAGAEGGSGWAAVLLVAAACVFWGLDNHCTALIDGLTPARTTFWKGLAAGVFNLGLAAILGAGFPGPGPVAGALAVGALAYGVSISLYIAGAQQLGAVRAQMVFAGAPFFGAALAWIVLREPLTPVHGVAAAVLLASLALLFLDRHDHEHAHEALEHEHSHRHDDGHHTHVHPGLPASHRHSHRHRHEPLTHAHPHLPDLHHRHAHGGARGRAATE